MAEKIATRAAYGKALVEFADQEPNLVVLDADLSGSTMTKDFGAAHPDRFFDMGIAEANMVGVAAGLATCGKKPFVNSFAMFAADRAWEQVRNSVAYPNMNVKLAMTHAGITLGEDGGSHQAVEDLALMRVIPGMTVLVPCDAKETVRAVEAAAQMKGPVYLRLARPATRVFEQEMPFEIGKANILREGSDVALFACGIMVAEALDCAEALAKQGVEACVVNIHTVKPLDTECILQVAKQCGRVVTIEEHSVIGGLGDAVASALMGQGSFAFRKIGIEDRFGQSGKPEDLMREYGLDTQSLLEQIQNFLKEQA